MSPLAASRKTKILALAILVVTTVLLFSRTVGFQFINYDDPSLVQYNSHVNTGFSLDNIKWAFTSNDLLQWVPLTWLTHMLDFQLYGRNASGHHFSSVVYHLVNVLLLLGFLQKATGRYWASLFVSALFALHPLHVEPVAWITARKDLVSTLFLLITLLLYLAYVKRPGPGRYLLVLVGYLLSLMAKPMYVTLPFLLLLLDYWPLQRVRFREKVAEPRKRQYLCLLEKLPFCILTVVFSVIAYVAQSKAGAITPFSWNVLLTRAVTVVLSYGEYTFKTFWPARLAVVYPFETPVPAWEVVLSSLAIIVIFCVVLWQASARSYLIVGWLWFLLTLLPVIGLVQIGPAFLSDKFTYFPIVGIFIMVAWGTPELLKKVEYRGTILIFCSLTLLSLLTIRSWRYVECWKDSETLYLEALRVTRNNFMVLGNLAAVYKQQGKYDDAMRYYQKSVQAEPRFDAGYTEIGYLYLMRSDYRGALPFFQTALRLRPGYPKAMAGLYTCLNNCATGN